MKVPLLIDFALSNIIVFSWYLFTALSSLLSFVASMSSFVLPVLPPFWPRLKPTKWQFHLFSLLLFIPIDFCLHPIIFYARNKLFIVFYFFFHILALICLILRWTIHLSAFLFCFFISLHYCKDNVVILCCGCNLSFSTSNNPMLV